MTGVLAALAAQAAAAAVLGAVMAVLDRLTDSPRWQAMIDRHLP